MARRWNQWKQRYVLELTVQCYTEEDKLKWAFGKIK